MMGAVEVWFFAFLFGAGSLFISRYRKNAVGWIVIADISFLVDMYYAFTISFNFPAANLILFMLSLVLFVVSLYKTFTVVWSLLRE